MEKMSLKKMGLRQMAQDRSNGRRLFMVMSKLYQHGQHQMVTQIYVDRQILLTDRHRYNLCSV